MNVVAVVKLLSKPYNIKIKYCEYHLHSQKPNRHAASCQLFYRLVATCQQDATNLSISSSCHKSVTISCCNFSFADLLQLVEIASSKPVDNKF